MSYSLWQNPAKILGGIFIFSSLFQTTGSRRNELFCWIAEEPGTLSSLIKDSSFLGHTIPAAGKTQPQEKRLQTAEDVTAVIKQHSPRTSRTHPGSNWKIPGSRRRCLTQ